MRKQRKLLDNYVQTLQWRGMNWTVPKTVFDFSFQCAQMGCWRSHVVTTPKATSVCVKRVGRGGGARYPLFFLVAFPGENDSSHFSLFSSPPSSNAIFRFHTVIYRVEIKNCILLDSVQKRPEAGDNYKLKKYVVKEITLLLIISGKMCVK